MVNFQAILTIATIVVIKSSSRDKGSSRKNNILRAQKTLFSWDSYVGWKKVMQKSSM